MTHAATSPEAGPVRLPASYNLHRYYDPETGRYTQADPIGLDGGLNLFSYSQHNPLRFSDPSGLGVPTSQESGYGVYHYPNADYTGGSPRRGRCCNSPLTREQVMNIVFNESRSVVPKNGNDKQLAMALCEMARSIIRNARRSRTEPMAADVMSTQGATSTNPVDIGARRRAGAAADCAFENCPSGDWPFHYNLRAPTHTGAHAYFGNELERYGPFTNLFHSRDTSSGDVYISFFDGP